MLLQRIWHFRSCAVKIEPSIASVGARAARLLDQHPTWTVEAVFDRSFYIRGADEFICVGEASIGDGPLNAVLRSGSKLPHLDVGHAVSLGISTAEVWRVPTWSTRTYLVAFEQVQHVIQLALREAPLDSFTHAVFSAREPTTALARRAVAGTRALRNGLKSGNTAKLDEAVSLFLGLGHGLTPSGDDALSGALMMLFALRKDAQAIILGRCISANMDNATSALSCAFLRAACDGEPSAALHQAITALLVNAPPGDVISPIRAIGQTSGFDMLAGVLLVAGFHSQIL